MHWCAAAAVLACAAAFAPARTPKITAVVCRELAASKEQKNADDDDWRRLANSKDAAADVFLSWAAEDPGLGACLRTLNLRRGRFGGDVPPALWPVQLRRKLARGLGRRLLRHGAGGSPSVADLCVSCEIALRWMTLIQRRRERSGYGWKVVSQ